MRLIGWLVACFVVIGLAVAAPALAGQAATAAQVPIVDGTVRSYGAPSAEAAWVLAGETLWSTGDGGATWRTITPPTMSLASLVAVSFIDARTGWLAAPAANPGYITVAATADGGRRWQMREQRFFAPADPAGHIGELSMHWLDQRAGWIVVTQATSSNFNRGALFATEDGGVTWQQRTLPGGEPVFFVSAAQGWTAGGPNGDTLYHTGDGGRTWARQPLPYNDAAAPGQRRHDLPVFTVDGQHGIVAVATMTAEAHQVRWYATHDGGATWSAAEGMPAVGSGASVVQRDAAAWLMASTGLPLAQGVLPAPYRAATGTPADIQPVSLRMVTPVDGWAQERAGAMLRTGDGGRSWQPVFMGEAAATNVAAVIERSARGADANNSPAARTARLRGPGFDMCELAGEEDLRRWMDASPYRAVNLYIGGALRFCANTLLNAEHLERLALQGWTFIPTWVGPQAPCTDYRSRFDANPATAFAQGRTEAEQALQVAQTLGLAEVGGAGTVIYYDLEAYDGENNACVEAARAFVAGWTQRIQQGNSYAGLYTLACNPPLARYGDLAPAPDAVWFAAWTRQSYDPAVTVNDLPASCLPPALWNQAQRIRQYTGSHDETWGGITLEIDSNVLDGIVADLAGVVEPPVTVIVETPALSPAYDARDPCATGWHRYTNVRGQPAYLSPAQPLGGTVPPLNYAIWQPTLPVTGTWRVEALIPSHGTVQWPCLNQTLSADTRSARYTIYGLDGAATSVHDQLPLNDDWLRLGSFQFAAGDGGQVYLDAAVTDAPVHVSFSAMRFTLEFEGVLPERLYLPHVRR